MSNQPRAGGIIKNRVGEADDQGIRQTLRGMEDIFDLDYVTRLFKDASIPNSKLVSGGGGGETGTIYRAILTQTSTNAPVPSIIQDDFGDMFFSYSGAGTYGFSSSGTVFTSDKTKVLISGLQYNGQTWAYVQGGAGYIYTSNFAGSLQDDWLLETFFEVIVYP